ncbi:MAG TPA: hypothetical protein VJ045_02825 [Hyphomicrobiaceae bacterium]|nr:hypothetical protein [Hyphomicrobiaceae bacterium]
MISTGLLGPFRLTFDGINDAIPRVSPGAYALGHTDVSGRFYVDFVGRADTHIRDKLHSFIGSATLFKYACLPNAEAAFLKECELYHAFKPPGNRTHPDRPSGTNWECPRCRFFRFQ